MAERCFCHGHNACTRILPLTYAVVTMFLLNHGKPLHLSHARVWSLATAACGLSWTLYERHFQALLSYWLCMQLFSEHARCPSFDYCTSRTFLGGHARFLLEITGFCRFPSLSPACAADLGHSLCQAGVRACARL